MTILLPLPLATRLRVLGALALRETCARFGRSPGGYLWAVAEPLGGAVVLTAVFGLVVASPPIGPSFMLFYATGLVPFLAFSAVANGAMNAASQNRGLMCYPSVTPLDVVLARAGLEALAQTAVAAVLLGGLVAALGLPVGFEPACFAAALAAAAGFGLAVGTANAALVAYVPAWRHVWAVANKPLFLVSGILFLPDRLPTAARDLLWFNPLAHAVPLMRAAFYGPDQALFVSPAWLGGVTLALFVPAALVVRRSRARFVEG